MAQSNAGAPSYLASALFGLAWLFFSQTAPVWHETTSVYPEPAVPMLDGWRRELVGAVGLELLRGRRGLTVGRHGALRSEPVRRG